MADELVAWLATEMSLVEPNHLSVSVEDVLSLLLLSIVGFVGQPVGLLLADVGDDKSFCDQWCDCLDRSSVSWRNLENFQGNLWIKNKIKLNSIEDK